MNEEQAKAFDTWRLNNLEKMAQAESIEDIALAAWQASAANERAACAEDVEARLEHYPTDVFPEPPTGQHGETIDACSARAIRNFIPSVVKQIRARGDKENSPE